ncbi:MAG TPA: septum formation initiator family protein [Candidatus Acidoferrum sp.]|nr:septum formation initiator family protein [Candidatus Acidoferrum sp.]
MNERPANFFEQMREFLRRNVTLFLAAALVLLLVQDIFGTHGVLAMRRAQKEATRVRQEIDRINSENRQLQDDVKDLKSDPQAIERIAREEMGLARPGEYIFKIEPKAGDAPATAPASQPNQSPQNP